MNKWILCLFLLIRTGAGWACTDFLLKSADNSCVVGRSMEFGSLLTTQIQLFQANENIQSSQKEGMGWTSKYSFLGMVFLPAKAVLDGVNEKGLSIGALWFPGTIYPQTPKNLTKNDIFFADVSSWLLGSFATVDEVKEALSRVNIYAGNVKGFSSIPPIHLSIHDADGKSLVLEFLNGKMHVFDNPIGVLTNAPEFPWHMTNLRNYLNLKALNVGGVNVDGTVLEPTGQGSGLMGIPGDWTPPSRFVRAAIFKQAIQQPKTAKDAILAAIHILNTVDIPYGAIRASSNQDFDFTQWIVIKDLKNKKLYYRTYPDQNIQVVSIEDNELVKKPLLLNTSP